MSDTDCGGGEMTPEELDQTCNAEELRQVRAERDAMLEWESRCAVALGVPECHPEEMLHVIDSMREDAERYRWLRDPMNAHTPSLFYRSHGEDMWKSDEDLDAAIDAAKKEGK